MRILAVILLLVVLLLGVVVGYFNATPVRLDYLAGQIEMPLAVLIVSEAVVVALLTVLLLSFKILGQGLSIRRLQRQIKAQQDELTALRNLPLRETPPPPPPVKVEARL